MTPCTLYVVTTEGFAIHAPAEGEQGAPLSVPRGLLVRSTPGERGDGIVDVRILSGAGWYVSDADPHGLVSIDPARLAPVDGLQFVALADGPRRFRAGDLLGTLTDPRQCMDRYTFSAAGDVPVDVLRHVRAVAPDVLAAADRVRAVYTELFGPIGRHEVPWTDWGYVGLPLPRPLDAAALSAEWAREGLDTPARREKATVALGPGEVPVYQHFLGSDAAGADIWAHPDTLIALLRLARGWFDHCVTLGGDPARCTLQIGDLAWYNAVLPDPLGHKDHNLGACFDLRLFRTDTSRYEAWWNRPDDRTGATVYDSARTEAFLTWAFAHAPVTEAFFNDPGVLAAVPGLRPLRGHDDHVHLCLGSPSK